MNAKMKSCFTPHAMMHSLFGLGLGLLIAALIAGHHMIIVWIGVASMVVSVVLDSMRKA